MKLRLLTLNVWGAPYAQHRAARMLAISEKIHEFSPDILCFQETYLSDDRRILQENLSDFKYQYYFSSGLLGSGLLTVSRYPITQTAFHRFTLGGKPEDIQRGDYYVGKGIGLTRIQTPTGILDVYNIHPHAQYQHTPDNEYAVYTNSNLYEAAQFIHAHSPVNPVILAGDYNTQPHQTGYQLVTTLAQILDVYHYLHPDSPGLTFAPENPYVQSPPQRLDYVMVKSGTKLGFDLLNADVVMTELLHQREAKTYSDHYGVLAELEIVDRPAAAVNHADGETTRRVLADLAKQLENALTQTLLSADSHTEKAIFGFASLLDAGFTVRLFLGWFSAWHKIRNLLLFLSLLYAGYHGLHAGILLPTRRQTLTALLREIELQLDQCRAFNDIAW